MRSTHPHFSHSTPLLPHRVGRRGLSLFSLLAASLLCIGELSAQETATERSSLQNLSEKISAQGRQLEVLTAEVAELTRLVGELAKAAGVEAPATPRAEPATPAPATTSAPTATPETPEPAAPEGPTHLVQKGETLTSIARQHGITVEELKRINKVTDERKLQIGQTLVLPQPAAPAPTE